MIVLRPNPFSGAFKVSGVFSNVRFRTCPEPDKRHRDTLQVVL